MGKVFISYRREDSAGHTGRLQERLSAELGRKNVFVDVESIQPGADFIQAVERSVKAADLVLVVIGKDWLNVADKHGARRLDNPADHVHQEVAMALASKAKVLPVLVQGARMPSSADLPKPLQSLATRNAVELRDTRWDDDVNHLIKNFGGISALRRLFRRRSIKILSVLMLFGLLVGGYVFLATEKVASSVEQFLTLLALDQVDQAYALTSQPFQASVTRQRFAQEVERLGLKDNASATWSSRELGGGKAVLKGSVLTKGRAVIPLTVTLIQEHGDWKILHFEGPVAGIQASGAAPSMPDDSGSVTWPDAPSASSTMRSCARIFLHCTTVPRMRCSHNMMPSN